MCSTGWKTCVVLVRKQV